MPLFTADDLSALLGATVDTPRAESVERLVWGWLKPALRLSDRPDPVPDEVFSWALELAGIAYQNPTGLARKQLASGMLEFSLERREQILRDASETGIDGAAALSPRGSFPAAQCYPDPAW